MSQTVHWQRLRCWFLGHAWTAWKSIQMFFVGQHTYVDRRPWSKRGYAVFQRWCPRCRSVDVDVDTWEIPHAWEERTDVLYPVYDEVPI